MLPWYVLMMRTTINLPDRLLSQAKKRARERNTTLGAVVTDALRLALSRPAETAASGHFTLVTFKGDGTLPGIDLARSSELYALDDVDQLHVSDSRRPRSAATGSAPTTSGQTKTRAAKSGRRKSRT